DRPLYKTGHSKHFSPTPLCVTEPTDQIILSIETAVAGGSLALYRNGGALAEMSGDAQISRAADLLPNIDKLLQSNNLELRDIGSIAVSLGPGSYTGIRIGIATALGLARSVDLIIKGVSHLKAIAADASTDGRVIAAVPIGREDIAWQVFDNGSPVTEPRVGSFDDLIAALSDLHGPATFHHYGLSDRLNAIGNALNVTTPDLSLAALIASAAARGHAEPHLAPIYLINPARSRNLF
ncbi:MAG TPA: tRNA (adenosine(37)-N6)-threonylcarbamoyltransferase complex dimerization subunit type 1 TsaB, partial [Pyrinomonadaceae bacterium]|nr:tRNA (adenosine(37)-N6)-threonylcarbamoyltransferase complex dimerization subunit type 1 TsaB [Pyrinomonadaceae bacterium]